MKTTLITAVAALVVGMGIPSLTSNHHAKLRAVSFDNNDYYSLLSTAIDASNSNNFEDNKNPQMFDSDNAVFKKNVSSRKDVDTYASNISSTSAYEFSEKYAQTFSTSLDTYIQVSGVTTDVSGKFDTKVKTESWKQKIESYEYYYWFAQKYIVNVDWKTPEINQALSSTFKDELKLVDSVLSAKALLREYGTHVYKNYVLGGKMEITKYFTQDASYELSDSEKSVAASLNVIVDAAKVDAKISGSVNLSSYESNSSSSSKYFSKLSYHAYGGDTNGAMNASDLFQYKTQFGTGTSSGFLYEAWTNSFNNDDVPLKVVQTRNPVAIWDILDATSYASQIQWLKKAWDNMCYESYATKCEQFGIPCNYIDSLTYTSGGANIKVVPSGTSVSLPENTSVKINLSNLVKGEFSPDQYALKVDPDSVATLTDDTITINSGTVGRSFNIVLEVEGIKTYSLLVRVKKESLGGGYGTKEQPYLINSKSDLLSVLQDLSASDCNYQLANDIDLGGEKVDVAGSGTSSAFMGTFDGNGFAIKNCTVKTSNISNGFPYIGLFGKNNGTIKNLTLDNVRCINKGLAVINNENITLSAGVLVGYNAGVIHNCVVKNSAIRISTRSDKKSTIINVGGIAGCSEGLIEYSAFTNGNIYGIAMNDKGLIHIGGIAGQLSGAKILKSYVNQSNINAFNAGKKQIFRLGGIVGSMEPRTAAEASSINPKLSICLVYSVSKNQEGDMVGGMAGAAMQGEFSNCYFAARKDVAVAGKPMNNCTRMDSVSLSLLPSVFRDEWMDAPEGPVLIMHKR